MARVYCNNCKQCSDSKLKGSGWITFILILFYIVPGLIYMVWRRSGLGICSFCGSSNLLPESNKPKQQVQQLPNPFPNNYISNNQQPFENVRQVNCPDCRELIRFDARKCKHCGSFIEDAKTSP